MESYNKGNKREKWNIKIMESWLINWIIKIIIRINQKNITVSCNWYKYVVTLALWEHISIS